MTGLLASMSLRKKLLAIVMIITATFVAINILVDVLYSLIDPRVRR